MRHIVIGDIHGRTIWKDIVKKHPNDLYIFLGDYVDSFYEPLGIIYDNFMDIIKFKRENKEQTILLLGNHDLHYSREFQARLERYSGFSDEIAPLVNHILQANRDLFKMAYMHVKDKTHYLFTHAGVSKTFLKLAGYKQGNVSDFINSLPWNAFTFNSYDPYGDDKTSSPIWIRPRALVEDRYKIRGKKVIHIVGHTQAKKLEVHQANKLNIILCDTLAAGEYLIIEADGTFTIGKV